MERPILEAKNITKYFANMCALDNVNLTLHKGEIHCLAGENGCGKSTLVKIISGSYTQDAGTVVINGNEYNNVTPQIAIAEGIQVIYQDLSLFPTLTVAENIAMNKNIAEKSVLFMKKDTINIAIEQLGRIGVDMDVNKLVADLSIANKQLVAICRALSLDAKIIFMDEPTTALTQKEVRRLLSIVLELKKKGISIVFISHKLDEVFEIADNITVFRDGKKIGDFLTSELNEKSLSYHMTGHEVEYARYHRTVKENHDLLEVRQLSRHDNYKNVSFSLRPGDILGITGLLGAGRTEVALSLFGLNKWEKGEVYINGKKVNLESPMDALDHGIALLTEDRQTQGLFMEQSLSNNIASSILDRIKSKFGIIDSKKQLKIAEDQLYSMNVNTKNTYAKAKNLSGGNQQKVVIGKWLARNPKVFILDTPTVGIDIGSKAEIYEKIHEFANRGMGIILISDEIEEILANVNKLLVMYNGTIIGRFDADQLDAPQIKEKITVLINNPEQLKTGGKA